MKDNDLRAFPVDSENFVNLGMTLRDYFAAAAVPGLIRDGKGIINQPGPIAASAYDIAEALLAEREKRRE